MVHLMEFLKNKIVLTIAFSLGLTVGHLSMAQTVSPKSELISLNTEPCALSEGSIKEKVPLSLEERLYQAARRNDIEEAMQLIESGADLEAEGPLGSPLYAAIQTGRYEAARLLIESGADLNAANSRGNTPLFELVSANGGSIRSRPPEVLFGMAELLIGRGADVNAENNEGLTPLHKAYTHDVRLAELLIKHGANVHAKSHKGHTPLHFAVGRFLAKNDKGHTPIYLPVNRILTFKYVKLLLDSGADVNVLDAGGNTPLHLAMDQKRRRLRVERLLIASGADIRVVNDRGETPLDLRDVKAAENALIKEGKSKEIHEYPESFGEPICEMNAESDKYLYWNKLSYFEGKPTGVSSGSVMLDQNGAIWYVKHPKHKSQYATEYLSGKLLQLMPPTNILGNNFSEIKLVKNYKSITLASRIMPGFQGFVDYAELEDPVGAELVVLAMFLIQHADATTNNVGVVLREGREAEMALIDYDQGIVSDTRLVDADMLDQDKDNLSELLVRRFHYAFMNGFGIELNGEALQDAAAVIAGIARDDIIQTFEDGHKDILEMGVYISESKINEWRDALLKRYDIICSMAEKMDYFTLVK